MIEQKNIRFIQCLDSWIKPLLERLHSICNQRIEQKGKCHIMLTGGRSASQLYKEWAKSIDGLTPLNNIDFYFGDERCVPLDHIESNHRIVMRDLFPNGIPSGIELHRMEAEAADLEAVSDAYSELLPDALDVLLLSVGEDGHIASLFPQGAALHEPNRQVVPITGPKAPFQRLTVTPKVIQSARHVFVMAIGEQKKTVYEKALQDPEDTDSLPVRLVLNRTWIFGD